MGSRTVENRRARDGQTGRPQNADSEVTSELTATGEATISQLAQLFKTDAKTLPQRLSRIAPRGTRRGYKVYSIVEAASMIVRPGYEIEEFIRQMSPQELPPLLLKEFWNGQRARQTYEREQGNYWLTEEVVHFMGKLLNTMRLRTLLVTDDVDREEQLTDGQKTIVRRIMDGAIVELRKEIEERFKDYHADRADSGLPLLVYDDHDENIMAAEDADDDGNILASEEDEEEGIGI